MKILYNREQNCKNENDEKDNKQKLERIKK